LPGFGVSENEGGGFGGAGGGWRFAAVTVCGGSGVCPAGVAPLLRGLLFEVGVGGPGGKEGAVT
jgi:hypothetical protein